MRSARAGATANRAVFFSGLTVVLALAGMLIVPATIFRGLAGGAIMRVVIVSVAASMTMLPAVLAVLGATRDQLASGVPSQAGRWNKGEPSGGFWDTVTRTVWPARGHQSHPGRQPVDPVCGPVLPAVASGGRRHRDQDGLVRRQPPCRTAWKPSARPRCCSPSSRVPLRGRRAEVVIDGGTCIGFRP